MEQTKKTLLPAIPDTVPPEIKSKFNLALTSASFQKIADEEMTLVYNEDHVEDIKLFLNKANNLKKVIEATHKTGKEEALKIGRNWDAAKNSFLAQVEAIVSTAYSNYSKLCASIAEKQKKDAEEKQRVAVIKNLIEANAVNLSMKIAGCDTTKDLLAIESIINLEKTRKEKYQEFLPDAIERLAPLTEILKNQKLVVKEREDLAAQKLAAEKSGNDEKLMEVIEKQEANVQQIESNKITVQEKAIEQPVRSFATYTPVSTPTVKPKRTTVKWRVIAIGVTQKRMPSWVRSVPVDELIDAYLATIKDKVLKEGSVSENGIEFFVEKTY